MTLSIPAGAKAYLDTNVFIYAFEAQNRWTQALVNLFRLVETKSLEAVTSELTLAELLVKPLMLADDAMVSRYRRIFSSGGLLTLVPVDRSILEDAARIRSMTRVRLIDAIHLASCASRRCEYLVSNDGPMTRALPVGTELLDFGALGG